MPPNPTHNPKPPTPQASFLHPLTPTPKPASKWDQAAPPDPAAAAEASAGAMGLAHAECSALLAELRGLGDEEVERRCRQGGLSARGGRCGVEERVACSSDFITLGCVLRSCCIYGFCCPIFIKLLDIHSPPTHPSTIRAQMDVHPPPAVAPPAGHQ